MIDPIIMNARKPNDDEYGLAMLNRMNERHSSLHQWALSHVSPETAETILDIGFGGGQNIKNLNQKAPGAKIYGIDYSDASYKKCAELNHDAIEKGSVEIQVGSAENLPYKNDTFDLVTALETVYYWPNIETCFTNVYKILKKDGVFMICNEDSELKGNESIADALKMNFYNAYELEELLKKAGFSTIITDSHENGKWVCAVGQK